MYDQRLFNQEGGMGSGLNTEDTYNIYDKALFADRGSNLYRPRAGAAEEDDGAAADERVRAFKPDKVRPHSSLRFPIREAASQV